MEMQQSQVIIPQKMKEGLNIYQKSNTFQNPCPRIAVQKMLFFLRMAKENVAASTEPDFKNLSLGG